jgi:hypothetical protein
LAVECYNIGPSYTGGWIYYINCTGGTQEQYFNPGETGTLCIDELLTDTNNIAVPTGVQCYDCTPCPPYNPAPLICTCHEITISQEDIDNATGNNNPVTINGAYYPSANGKVFFKYFECGYGNEPRLTMFGVAGIYNICIWSADTRYSPALVYFQGDVQLTAPTSSYVNSLVPCNKPEDCDR